jgi:hypothetical protein
MQQAAAAAGQPIGAVMHFAAYADGDLGEDHNPETHLIPLVLDVMAGRSPYQQIFGYSVQQVIEAAKAGAEKAGAEKAGAEKARREGPPGSGLAAPLSPAGGDPAALC